MRTTVTLDRDVAAAVERLRRDAGLGVSAALNELARRGLSRKPETERFTQETSDMGLRIDVSDIPDALDFLEGSNWR